MHFLNINHLKTWFNLGSCKKNYFNLLLYNSQAVRFQKDRSLWVFNDFEKFPHPWWTAFKPSQPTFLLQPGKSFSSTCARVPDITYLYDYTFMPILKNIINWFCILFSLKIFAFALIFYHSWSIRWRKSENSLRLVKCSSNHFEF